MNGVIARAGARSNRERRVDVRLISATSTGRSMPLTLTGPIVRAST